MVDIIINKEGKVIYTVHIIIIIPRRKEKFKPGLMSLMKTKKR